MAGNKQKSSFFNIFRVKKGRKDQDCSYPTEEKSYPSDEDNSRRVVADPRIDMKASVFIADFHKTSIVSAEPAIHMKACVHHQEEFYPSGEDNTRRVVADPRIDMKASVFIANFHKTCLVSAEPAIDMKTCVHHHEG